MLSNCLVLSATIISSYELSIRSKIGVTVVLLMVLSMLFGVLGVKRCDRELFKVQEVSFIIGCVLILFQMIGNIL